MKGVKKVTVSLQDSCWKQFVTEINVTWPPTFSKDDEVIFVLLFIKKEEPKNTNCMDSRWDRARPSNQASVAHYGISIALRHTGELYRSLLDCLF